MHLFALYGLIAHFEFPEEKLNSYFLAVSKGYFKNPFHNEVHAADVYLILHSTVTRAGYARISCLASGNRT